jgi:hypothetical protein
MDVSKNPTNLISSFYIGDCTINVTEMWMLVPSAEE